MLESILHHTSVFLSKSRSKLPKDWSIKYDLKFTTAQYSTELPRTVQYSQAEPSRGQSSRAYYSQIEPSTPQ